MRQLYDGAIIDTLTGAETYSEGGRRKRLRPCPDTLTVSPQQFAALAATDFIRVRAWKENPTARFMVFSLSDIASGTCEVVH
jgi:hypothetical protein